MNVRDYINVRVNVVDALRPHFAGNAFVSLTLVWTPFLAHISWYVNGFARSVRLYLVPRLLWVIRLH